VRKKLRARGVALFLDFVGNHTAHDHPWVREHPEYYVQGTKQDFERDPGSFRLVETPKGSFFIALARDPYFPPWKDVAQLNHFSPQMRAAQLADLRTIAGHCDGVRCDMAMLHLRDIFGGIWGRYLGNSPPPATEFWTDAAPAWKTPDADGLFALMWDKGVRTTEMQEFFGITQEQRRSARVRLQLTPRDPKTSVRRRVKTREAVVKPKPVVDRPVTSTRAIGRSGVQTIGSIDWHAVNLCPKPVWRAGQCRWPLHCEEPAAGRFCAEHAGLLARKVA